MLRMDKGTSKKDRLQRVEDIMNDVIFIYLKKA